MVRAIVDEFLKNEEHEIKFLHIYSYAWQTSFYYVHQDNINYSPANEVDLADNKVDFNHGDIILFLDLHPASAISKTIEI